LGGNQQTRFLALPVTAARMRGSLRTFCGGRVHHLRGWGGVTRHAAGSAARLRYLRPDASSTRGSRRSGAAAWRMGPPWRQCRRSFPLPPSGCFFDQGVATFWRRGVAYGSPMETVPAEFSTRSLSSPPCRPSGGRAPITFTSPSAPRRGVWVPHGIVPAEFSTRSLSSAPCRPRCGPRL
jgi:hypothetical protein